MERLRTHPIGYLRPFLRNGPQVRVEGLSVFGVKRGWAIKERYSAYRGAANYKFIVLRPMRTKQIPGSAGMLRFAAIGELILL